MKSTSRVCFIVVALGVACARIQEPEIRPVATVHDAKSMRSAIVSVIITGQHPDWSSPWVLQRPWTQVINGVIIDGRRILVSAQHLARHRLVEVEHLGESERFEAKVRVIDFELPLALLEVPDERFWQGVSTLPIAREAPIEGDVAIGRWLSSGQFEMAKATIRQVVVASHYPGLSQLLSLDISSSVQAGGWSEVVLQDGQVVGLTTSANNSQLSAIAAPVLTQFVDKAESEQYTGVARHGFTWQPLTNPALRKRLGVPKDAGGIVVRGVLPHGSAAGVLEPGDVVLSIAGQRINRIGKFEDSRYGKLSFGVLFTNGAAPGESLAVEILRRAARIQVELKLKRMAPEQNVVPYYDYDGPPEFVVVGGLVFQPLTRHYLEQWRDWRESAPLRLLIADDQRGEWPTQPGERIIVLSRVLPDACNLGYEELHALIVGKVNGVTMTSMDDLKAALSKPQGDFHIIELLPGQGSERVVIDAKEAAAADGRIREQYGL